MTFGAIQRKEMSSSDMLDAQVLSFLGVAVSADQHDRYPLRPSSLIGSNLNLRAHITIHVIIYTGI